MPALMAGTGIFGWLLDKREDPKRAERRAVAEALHVFVSRLICTIGLVHEGDFATAQIYQLSTEAAAEQLRLAMRAYNLRVGGMLKFPSGVTGGAPGDGMLYTHSWDEQVALVKAMRKGLASAEAELGAWTSDAPEEYRALSAFVTGLQFLVMPEGTEKDLADAFAMLADGPARGASL